MRTWSVIIAYEWIGLMFIHVFFFLVSLFEKEQRFKVEDACPGFFLKVVCVCVCVCVWLGFALEQKLTYLLPHF
ncbi:hypothetical protein QBC42DRAFT_276908 [Cladorrhinum samala]|uniref:Uncharacterized protein n=1 Tax=Cladorrhinum samala TaxID=585594 RepID=A0AAV9HD81_9PEZI|nr:hypothetical protein QBC42DRAFT_276908 [Cladorrhinum samala]